MNQRIRRALFRTMIFVSACLSLSLVFELTNTGITTTIAYPPPQSVNANLIATGEPYPSPTLQSQAQEELNGNLAYPSPIDQLSDGNTQPTFSYPKDRIVAVYSNGQYLDLDETASQYSSQVLTEGDSQFVLPRFPDNPDNQANPAPLRIIGPDDRFKIQNTKVFPWTTVVKVQGAWAANTPFECTGWMLGASTVVTAGHCVYNFIGTKTFAYNVTVTPALNTDDSNSMPFGSCRILTMSVLSPWIDSGDVGYDYGVYRLACRVGQQTGNLGFKSISGSGVGTSLALTGYPGDKGGTTMWASLGSVTSSTNTLFFYDNDMMPGQSGGPVWDYIDPNCHVCVVAINAQEYDPPTMNSGPRVNQTAFNYFLVEQQFVAQMVFLPLIIK